MRFLLSACFCKVCACVSDALRLASHILLTNCSCDLLALLAHLLILYISRDSTVYIYIYLFDHPVFVSSCCMGVHSHSHSAYFHSDYGTFSR